MPMHSPPNPAPTMATSSSRGGDVSFMLARVMAKIVRNPLAPDGELSSVATTASNDVR